MRADLTTNYLGMSLKNPIVASAGPLTGDVEFLQRLEQAGVAAAVLPSLFEEQINRDEQRLHALYEFQNYASAESLSYFPKLKDFNVGPNQYLQLVQEAKRSLSIPVIGSLNGSSPGGWARYAKLIQEAGADAIELNIYFIATDPEQSSADVEGRYMELVSAVRDTVRIPIAVKIGPQFSSLCNFIPRLIKCGATGVVLFNRYLEPDIDLDSLTVVPQLVLSNPSEMRLPLRWIAILRDQIPVSIGATSGIHTFADVVKLLLVGADACLITSVLLKKGTDYVADLLSQLQEWLRTNGYDSVEQMKGSMSRGNCANAGDLERANYMKAIVSYTAAH
jgi:dihydroorotate dehydrogenase (fumarate)